MCNLDLSVEELQDFIADSPRMNENDENANPAVVLVPAVNNQPPPPQPNHHKCFHPHPLSIQRLCQLSGHYMEYPEGDGEEEITVATIWPRLLYSNCNLFLHVSIFIFEVCIILYNIPYVSYLSYLYSLI